MSVQFMIMLYIAIYSILTLCNSSLANKSNWHKTAFTFFVLSWSFTLLSLYDSGPLPSNTLEETRHLTAVSQRDLLYSLIGLSLILVSICMFLFATRRSRLADHNGCQNAVN